MDVLETKNVQGNYIEMLDSDFYKLIGKYDLPEFIDGSLNEYTLYNGFVIKSVPHLDYPA